MSPGSKKRTTFAKLNREQALREKRVAKSARKTARKLEAAAERDQPQTDDEAPVVEEER